MPTIKIDNVDYDIDSLTTEAKQQLQSLQFCDAELQASAGYTDGTPLSQHLPTKRTASALDRFSKIGHPALVNFWNCLPHRTPTPPIGVDGTQTTYALCFARSMSKF